jgi:hypothetical protein
VGLEQKESDGTKETDNPDGLCDTMKKSETQKIKEIEFINELLINSLEGELEKQYADPRVMDLLERAGIITIKRD